MALRKGLIPCRDFVQTFSAQGHIRRQTSLSSRCRAILPCIMLCAVNQAVGIVIHEQRLVQVQRVRSDLFTSSTILSTNSSRHAAEAGLICANLMCSEPAVYSENTGSSVKG